MHEYYPELALFVTEYGAESNHNGPADQKGTYEFQRDLLRYHAKTYITKPYLNGALTWVLKDFRSRPDWNGGSPTPQPPWNQKGLAGAALAQEAGVRDDREVLQGAPVARRPYLAARAGRPARERRRVDAAARVLAEV